MSEKLKDAKLLRRLVQAAFALTTIVIGIQFYMFYRQLQGGAESVIARPPGVEGFLPISSLMSLKYWVLSGDFNHIHPAGLLIFLIILATALFLKRGFCSWVCPVGLISELLSKIHVLIFRKPRRVWRWLDYPLRSLKYLLLGFFCWVILLQMSEPALKAFIHSSYNKTADLKMLVFFIHATSMTIKVLVTLVVLSILIRNFWCRYLCPYGALLGMASGLSPLKIRRNADRCIDCRKCTKACPASIDVHRPHTVYSDECHACLQCVAACPVKDTLALGTRKRKISIRPMVYALLIIALFAGTTLAARLFDLWQNDIPLNEYRYYVLHLDQYNHAHGMAPSSESAQ